MLLFFHAAIVVYIIIDLRSLDPAHALEPARVPTCKLRREFAQDPPQRRIMDWAYPTISYQSKP